MNELSGVLPDSFLQLESLTDFAFEDNDGLYAPIPMSSGSGLRESR